MRVIKIFLKSKRCPNYREWYNETCIQSVLQCTRVASKDSFTRVVILLICRVWYMFFGISWHNSISRSRVLQTQMIYFYRYYLKYSNANKINQMLYNSIYVYLSNYSFQPGTCFAMLIPFLQLTTIRTPKLSRTCSY